MADDLQTMKARIASELARSDLTTQIASAISDAIAIYQKERFRFNETDPSTPVTFSTVANQAVYTSSANANIATLFSIDYMLLTIGNQLIPLTYDTAENLRIQNQINTTSGQPESYAYEGNQIIMSPVPSDVWTVTMGLFRKLAAPANDAEANNPWMIAAERLIRSRAKYEIGLHVTRNAALQEAMSPHPPPPGKSTGHATWWAWRELKAETNRVTSLKRIRAMPF